MNKIFPILLLLISLNSLAQDSTATKTQYLKHGFTSWKLDGKRINNKQFRDEIYKVPEAIPDFSRSRTQLFTGIPLFVTGTVVTEIIRRKEMKYPYTTNDHTAMKITFSAIMISGAALITLAFLNRNKAAKLYNSKHLTTY